MEQPLPNTYWVVPGRLLAGEYPYGRDEADARVRVQSLREAGIDYFVDLTQVDERPEYAHLVRAYAKYLRCPIPDMEVPDDVAQMQEIQARIRAGLLFGRCLYVHCRAGIGRTATVIGCYLVEQGQSGKDALKQVNKLWRQSARSATWPKVPQTAEQAAYIVRWPLHAKPRKHE